MKVLWFSNIPLFFPDKGKPPVNSGGWISSLESLIKTKDEVELFVSYFGDVPTLTQIKNDGVTYYILPNQKNRVKKYLNKLFGYSQRERSKDIDYYFTVVDSIKPDIIHVFGSENSFGLISKYTNIPVLIHIQGVLNSIYKKFLGCDNFSYYIFSSSLKSLVLLRNPLFKLLSIKRRLNQEKEIFNISKFISGRTEWDRKITKMYSPNAKYFHIDELLREPFYRDSFSKGHHSNSLTIVSILNDNPYKGISTLMKTLYFLNKKRKIKFIWRVIGLNKKDQTVKVALKKHQKTDYISQIEFLGRLNASEVYLELSNASIYVHTSIIENSPNSICEAMMLGKPVIANYVGGIPSLINNNLDGVLIEPNSPEILATEILRLWNDKSLMKKLGSNAKKRAILRHDKNKILQSVLNTYKIIISDSV